MGKTAGELVYKTRMDGTGKMEGDASRAERSLDKMEGATGRASGGLFTLQGAIMAAGGAFGASKLLGYMREGVDLASKLEKRSTKLASTIRILGGNADDVENLTTQMRGLGIAYGQASPEGVMDTYEQMITTSYGMVEAQREINTILQANVAGWGDTNEHVENASRAMETFNLRAGDTERILGAYEVATTRGHIATDKIRQAFEKEAPTLKQINAGFEETVGLLVALSAGGSDKAVRNLTAMLRVLGAETGPVADELHRVGVVTGDGIVPILESLAEKQDEIDWYKIAPDVATQSLLKTSIDNLDLIKERIADVEGASGLLSEAYRDAADDSAFMAAISSAGLNEVKMSAGEALLKGLAPLAAGLGEGADAGEFLTGVFAGLALGAYNVAYGLVGLGSVAVSGLVNWYKLLGLTAKEAYYWMTFQFDKALETIKEKEKVSKAATGGLEEYFAGFRGLSWGEEMIAGIGDQARGSTEDLESLINNLRELQREGGAAPAAPGGLAPAPALAEEREPVMTDDDLYRLERARELVRETQSGWDEWTRDTNAAIADYERRMEQATESIAGGLTQELTGAFEGAGIGDILEDRARRGLEQGVMDGLRTGLSTAGAAGFLSVIADALNMIPVIGPLLSGFFRGFISMQHGGVAMPLAGGLPALLADRGRPEVAFPLEARAIHEVSKALDLVGRDMFTPADVATFGGGADAGIGGRPEVNVLVQGVDPLGLEVYEVVEMGKAAALLKTV